MNARDDGARPAKRRRLNIVNDHQTQAEPTTPHIQLYPPLGGYQEPLPDPEIFDDGRVQLPNGVCVSASPNVSANKNGLGRIEQELSECCYGMVRRTSIDANSTFPRLLIDLLHSYVIFRSASNAD
jgi:hypothetical protein